LADKLDLPIATGECEQTRWGFQELYCFRSKPGQNAKVKHADVPIMRLIQ